MKSTLSDYVLSSLLLGIVAVLSLVGVGFWASCVDSLFGIYAAVANILVFLLVFGLVCSVMARMLLWRWPLGGGTISMSDRRFMIWKLYTVLYEFGCGALKPFTVMFLRPVVQQLFGARIGRDVALGGKLVDPHLIWVGDEAVIGEGAVVTAHAINSGSIMLAPVLIGRGATIGVGAVVYPDVVVGERAVVTANAVVRSGTRIPSGELWGGIPAQRLRGSVDCAD